MGDRHLRSTLRTQDDHRRRAPKLGVDAFHPPTPELRDQWNLEEELAIELELRAVGDTPPEEGERTLLESRSFFLRESTVGTSQIHLLMIDSGMSRELPMSSRVRSKLLICARSVGSMARMSSPIRKGMTDLCTNKNDLRESFTREINPRAGKERRRN